ncbi:MAG: type II/IV secretion system ATPase subunit [Candidatus Methanospirare jalkutatii]|nr:type II/IV secretion system ATPase subunit [Candidatus Methanospirare jalkutatii]
MYLRIKGECLLNEMGSGRAVLERYAVVEPYAFVVIETGTPPRYRVEEPELSEAEKEALEEAKRKIQTASTTTAVSGGKRSDVGDVRECADEIERNIEKMGLSEEQCGKIKYYLERDLLRYGELDVLLRDKNVEEISSAGMGKPIFVFHRKYGHIETNLVFNDEIFSILHKGKIKVGEVFESERLERGRASVSSEAQVSAIMFAGTSQEAFTIRKRREVTPVDLLSEGVFSVEMLAYLWMAVQHRFNILILGEPASGKTSVLHAISMFIPPNRRIVSVEDVRESNLPHRNCISLNVNAFDDEMELLNTAMKMHPDYIFVSEISSKKTANIFFQSIFSGVATLSTMNAISADALVNRLVKSPLRVPLDFLRYLDVVPVLGFVEIHGEAAATAGEGRRAGVGSVGAVDAVDAVKRKARSRVRRCTHLFEVVDVDYEKEEVVANELFLWQPPDEFAFKGESKVFIEIMNGLEMSEEELAEDFNRRITVLEWMRRKKLRFDAISGVMYEYEENPEELERKIERE